MNKSTSTILEGGRQLSTTMTWSTYWLSQRLPWLEKGCARKDQRGHGTQAQRTVGTHRSVSLQRALLSSFPSQLLPKLWTAVPVNRRRRTWLFWYMPVLSLRRPSKGALIGLMLRLDGSTLLALRAITPPAISSNSNLKIAVIVSIFIIIIIIIIMTIWVCVCIYICMCVCIRYGTCMYIYIYRERVSAVCLIPALLLSSLCYVGSHSQIHDLARPTP